LTGCTSRPPISNSSSNHAGRELTEAQKHREPIRAAGLAANGSVPFDEAALRTAQRPLFVIHSVIHRNPTKFVVRETTLSEFRPVHGNQPGA
jgi:hypothetical protein